MYIGEKLGSEAPKQESGVEVKKTEWRKWLGLKTGAVALSAAILFTGCSEADTVSRNISTAADNFEIERRIVFINGITDEIPLVIEGRCSIEVDGADEQLEVTCKTGPDEFEKHFLGLSDNMSYILEQQEPADADEYRTRIIIKPEQLVPDFELNTSRGN